MTDIPPVLTPAEVDSFAYVTFKDRLPVIITRIVDYVYRNKKAILDIHGDNKIECIKYITSELSRLRHELTTDKIITLFDGHLTGDEEIWNTIIEEERKRLIDIGVAEDNEIHWYKTSFLFGENYMYRRIWDIVSKSGLESFDPFCFEKEEQLQRGLGIIDFLSQFYGRIQSSLKDCGKAQLEEYFIIFLKMSLWGNEADLSLSVTEEDAKLKVGKNDPGKLVTMHDAKLLADDSRTVFAYLYKKSKECPGACTVTLVLDNCGPELLADMHLVGFLITSGLVAKVVLMVKPKPWYVSDVTAADLPHTLAAMASNPTKTSPQMHALAHTLTTHINTHTITVHSHTFLALPQPYHRMATDAADLHAAMASSSLIIFKGDLNYRRLLSDRPWPPATTSFEDSLQGFCAAPLVALRVLKCPVLAGVTPAALEGPQAVHPQDWMVRSQYGVIQAAGITQ